MARFSLAWFSPMPPVRTGIATDSATLVAALGDAYAIDVFVDDPVARDAPGTRSAHDFVWLNQQRPYDLTVYQLGNSSHHNYQWPYLFRYPGLAVLHDVHLHHARAAALLMEKRAGDYRAEFAANHPDANADLAELAAAGFDTFLYYLWPMTRLVAQTSRVTAVHSNAAASQLSAEAPGAHVERIALPHGVEVSSAEEAEARLRIRARFGIAADAVLFGVFGTLSPEKRLPAVLDAFAALAGTMPTVHLLLAGRAPSHYDLDGEIRNRDLGGRVTVTGYLEEEADLTACIAASDVALNLRWPTAREVSGPWLRAMAAGKPTITIDLAHLWDVPSLDPRTWRPNYAPGRSGARGLGGPGDPDPITVAIDILDEAHSLRLAMRRLARDDYLRAKLGSAARAYWRREHSLANAVAEYRRVIALASARPPQRPSLPEHLLDDGTRTVRGILADFGVTFEDTTERRAV